MKTKSRFQVTEYKNPKSISYRVYGRMPDGRVVRENFRTLPEALTRKTELEIESANVDGELLVMRPTRMSMAQLGDAEMALRRLAGKASLVDAADFYIRNARPDLTQITVQDAFERFTVDKKAQNLRERTLENLRVRVGRLVKTYGQKPVSSVAVDEIKRLIQRNKSPLTFNGDRCALHSFFAWCTRHDYTAANPVAKIPPARIERAEPVVLSLDEVKSLLKAALEHKDGVLVPYLSLALFCGLRPAELERLTWRDIDLGNMLLTIRGSAAKLRARRVVELTDNIAEWLRPYVNRMPVVGANWRRDFDAIRRISGFKGSVWRKKCDAQLRPWPADVLRHTSVSMWQAHFKDEGKCADRHGNSVETVHRHYRGVVGPQEAVAFWQLRPTNVNSHIIPLQAAEKAA